jgi:pimeloyl-ACP methyl ester carboxylesterase
MPFMSQNTQQPKPIVFKRLLRLLLLACFTIYLIALVFVSVSQRNFIYFPPVFTSQTVDQLAKSANLERWTNSSGQFIGMKRPSPRQPAVGRILILYGNASSTITCAHYVDDIQGVAALDAFIVEYPGYADRSGKPSQHSLFQAADEALQLLDTNTPIYLLGESLGTGEVAHLAGTHPDKVAGVILLSPYNRLTDVAQQHMPIFPVHLLLIDRFPSEDYLRSYHGPVGVVVDGHDQVVPEKFGLRLYNNYTGPKKLWEFTLGEHTYILEPPAKFWKEVVGFWQTIQPR